MRCYYVFIHGKLSWNMTPSIAETLRPEGFYCHRYVFATNSERAEEIALERVERNFDKMNDWLRKNHATLRLEVEDISPAGLFNLIRRESRGHVFYGNA